MNPSPLLPPHPCLSKAQSKTPTKQATFHCSTSCSIYHSRMWDCHSLLACPVTQAEFQIIRTLSRSISWGCTGSAQAAWTLAQHAQHSTQSLSHQPLSCSTARCADSHCLDQEQFLFSAQRALKISAESPNNFYTLLPKSQSRFHQFPGDSHLADWAARQTLPVLSLSGGFSPYHMQEKGNAVAWKQLWTK